MPRKTTLPPTVPKPAVATAPTVDHEPDAELPAECRPYSSLGVRFVRSDGKNAHAEECPFCGRAGKFAVALGGDQPGTANCIVCRDNPDAPKGGYNPVSFARRLWEIADCPRAEATALAADRGFLNTATVAAWGLRINPLTGGWVFPAFGPDGKVVSLFRYEQWPGDSKRVLRGAKGLPAGLFGVELFDPGIKETWVAESWNAPALAEVLSAAGVKANVLGIPGANSWQEKWADLVRGHDVVLAPDSDHPVEANGRAQDGAGYAGARRTAGLIAGVAASVRWLRWGPDGYDPDKPSGWDLRDAFTEAGPDAKARAAALEALAAKIEPVPAEWLRPPDRLQAKVCRSWKTLREAWKLALRWNDDLDHMLSMFLAAVVSTETVGDGQLWVLCMAPPSSGKTTLCEALGVARDRVVVRSVLRSVYSGYKESKDSTEDHGEVPRIREKTLVVTDGDPLLKDPNRGLILAQYRGLFDGTAKIKYNNGLEFDHEDVKFTLILCGTAAMRELDAAEVGARFINCSFPEHIDPVREREINRTVAYRALRNVRTLANGQPETRHDADKARAKALTGGYVEHLRENAAKLIGAVEENIPERTVEKLITFGEFVAHMRARPSKTQDEVAEREASHRLVEQFVRLAVCIAAVMNKKTIDAGVLNRVRRAALDTARGRGFRYAEALAAAGPLGVTVDSMVGRTGEPEAKVRDFLRFLTSPAVRVAARVPEAEVKDAKLSGRRWRLHSHFRKLWKEVVGATP